MARMKNGSGSLEKHHGTWLARWTVNGKRFTRSTGEKIKGGKSAKQAALKKLEEFTSGYELKDEKRILEIQVAKLGGVEKEISDNEDKKPALRFMEAWTVYTHSQSRPRSGASTLQNYEQQYFIFVDWMKQYHSDIIELRNVTRDIAEEYSQALLSGTSKDESDAIYAARKWLYGFDYRTKRDGARKLTEAEQKAIDGRRALASRIIRKPVRGATFNKHMNALALIWRHVSRHEKARIKVNPWSWDEDSGTGIRRIVLNHAERPHSRRALTVEEVFNLLKHSNGEMRALIAIGFYTGLRLGDAVLLQWGNIDRVTGMITARSRKTDTETRAAIHPALAKILQAEVKTNTGYLLPTLAETYLSGKSGRVKICNMISELLQSIGVTTKFSEGDGKRARVECGFHSLRHTFVTALRANGATLQTAKQLAGHNTERMTEHYTHDDGRAVLSLPDMTKNASIDTANATPETARHSASATVSQHRLSIEELRAALAGLSDDERAALLAH